ncbi:uncharacterized protein MYCFIDRAFT_200130 [Pseudocercospora fijiensis CIRAD86]|uniref:NTF2-like domain-containing protein n=1 Tax=Pseudocercospora fijiensis (strain CIRAD86) TaxID=383855 RepID=M2YIT6_PSEFD|nr:uncharacterized protein MYCFIDRAFT_200130 [Pseudocercospora fijiensis CIRAD86]EME77670.1 hypothetical protein MYCFIDRAFT_200130 [Pseudocercospora fijiensis CIRAD86]
MSVPLVKPKVIYSAHIEYNSPVRIHIIKMKFSIVASALIFGLAIAAPAADALHWPSICLSQPEANAYIQKFIGVFGRIDPNARQTGEKILADDFMEYSNSIRSLQDLPVGNL